MLLSSTTREPVADICPRAWGWAIWAIIGCNVAWIEDLIAISDVHRRLGDAEAARQDLEQAMQLARRWDTPTMVGQALHAQARAGIAPDPIEILREAVDLLGNSPARLECAQALVSLASDYVARRSAAPPL